MQRGIATGLFIFNLQNHLEPMENTRVYGVNFVTRVLQFANDDLYPKQVRLVLMNWASVHGGCSMYWPARYTFLPSTAAAP